MYLEFSVRDPPSEKVMFSFAPIGSLADKTICQVEIREALSWSSWGGKTDGGLRSRGGDREEVT